MTRRIFFLLILIASFTATVHISARKPEANIVFEHTDFNFGNVREEKGAVTHVFEFTNTGDAPLLIISVNASCGCTKPKYSQEPVRPGQKGEISVTYMPQNRPGEFNKAIRVRTNDPDHKRMNLRISGIVIPKK